MLAGELGRAEPPGARGGGSVRPTGWADKFLQIAGYESRACSDSEDSWEPDSSSERRPDPGAASGGAEGQGEPRSPGGSGAEPPAGAGDPRDGGDNATDSTSEASDSANTESRGFKTSGSSDSMDALEEDELEACSSSRPELFHFYTPTVQEMSSSDSSFVPVCAAGSPGGAGAGDYFCFLQVPPAEQGGPGGSPSGQGEGQAALEARLSEVDTAGYYSLCYSASPAGSASPGRGAPAREGHGTAGDSDLVLRPPPGFSDSSSEEEFYDAADRLSPPEALAGKAKPAGCGCFPPVLPLLPSGLLGDHLQLLAASPRLLKVL